jgi:uncharacterized protein YlxP (DUF503 family)
VAGGYVGIMSAELHFPGSRSLKDKRQFLRSTKVQLQRRFGASVAEVDHHDVWQRARLTIACTAVDYRSLELLLEGVERFLASQEYELGPLYREVIAPEL